MLNFTDYILQLKDLRQKPFQSVFRSYLEYHGTQYRKRNQRPPHLPAQKHLKLYEDAVSELEEVEKREKAIKVATATSEKVTDAVTTMIGGSLRHITATHLNSLKRPSVNASTESSDDDFEQQSPKQTQKKNRQEAHSTTDPWLALEQASIRLHNGEQGVNLPKAPTNLSSNHLRLFKIAHQCLEDANGPFKKDSDTINLKDAMVAMSCILNLRSPPSSALFPASFVAKATDDCYEDGYDNDELVNRCFAGMTDILKSEGVLGLRDTVEDRKAGYRKERQTSNSAVRSREEKLMDVVEIVCDLVLQKQFEEPHGEADTLHIWLKIFEKLLPANVKMKTGESLLACSKPGVSQKDEDMAGRKVDLKFLSHGIELAVIEFKSPSQSKSTIAKQFRKSLRLGKNIQQSLEELGVKDVHVLCGDVVGFRGSFTKIMKFEDIYVAGKVTDTVVTLPTTKHMLLNFLDGRSIAVLYSFLSYLDDLGTRAIEMSKATAVLAEEELFEQHIEFRKPVPLLKKKTLHQSVVYSPKRS
ncbi:hypothetical protein EDD11_004860 [Mortierella claussenii]|nr:hypothetical protein EDD11_004860 [Mortierella claussenii]